MKKLSKIWYSNHRKLLLLTSPILWIWLSGQNDFQLSDLQANYDTPAVIPTSFYIGVAFAISATVGGFFGLRFYRAKMEELQQIRIKREQTDMTLHTLYESLKMSEDEVELVHKLGSNREAEEILSMMRDNKLFEEAVGELLSVGSLDADLMLAIHAMRTKLQFNLTNKDCEVITTKMLLSNMRVECSVTAKGRQMAFISLIKEVGERGVRIDPPMIKRRPANILQFKVIRCRVRRQGDADYEFSMKVEEQKTETPAIVWLGHTNDICKMAIRESERLELNRDGLFRRLEASEYGPEMRSAHGSVDEYKVKGKILDMSAGGMKLAITQKLEDPLKDGEVLLFHLSDASLREDMAATVLATIPSSKQLNVHLQFRDSNALTRIKLMQFLHRYKKHQAAA
jgi:c-di-GMP-binding flagellar brake protein YcgR